MTRILTLALHGEPQLTQVDALVWTWTIPSQVITVVDGPTTINIDPESRQISGNASNPDLDFLSTRTDQGSTTTFGASMIEQVPYSVFGVPMSFGLSGVLNLPAASSASGAVISNTSVTDADAPEIVFMVSQPGQVAITLAAGAAVTVDLAAGSAAISLQPLVARVIRAVGLSVELTPTT